MSNKNYQYLLAANGRLLGDESGVLFKAHSELDELKTMAVLDVGQINDQQYAVAILEKNTPIDSLIDMDSCVGLRSMLGHVETEEEYALLATAAQLVTWYESFKFCPRCATELSLHPHERAKVCGGCGHHQYPRISPCIIVLVKKGEQCLLAHAAKFAPGRYSTLAGFIEAGESAEHAVHREIEEEVGIKVKNIEYCFSQSWPFPHSLMLGFMAEYDSGDIQPDGIEILEADWFSADKLPTLPPRFTIARRLINRFLEEIGAEIEPDSALFFPTE
ncbi:NAD(+) diphosphatase [Neptuniibacter sp.]|uniref:NAD(+) diphosphatase n=1 Tax=Neptuniibacter sp. TaxID=1962643 RepID=UPI0026078728|nr:NAD(+) diphosphatase [Neptuniibacter sp.]MCP4597900.1 NAD(+) diphosphatase [Neptuniibacter sp.]